MKLKEVWNERRGADRLVFTTKIFVSPDGLPALALLSVDFESNDARLQDEFETQLQSGIERLSAGLGEKEAQPFRVGLQCAIRSTSGDAIGSRGPVWYQLSVRSRELAIRCGTAYADTLWHILVPAAQQAAETIRTVR